MEDATTTTCAACGVKFCMPAHLFKKVKETGQEFFCPNGHSLVFKPSENDRLRKQVEDLTRSRNEWRGRYAREVDRREALERTVRAYQMNLGKVKKRLNRLESQERVQA